MPQPADNPAAGPSPGASAKAPLILPAALAAAVWLICTSAQAACSRGDVDYYLDKGFTPEQVAALCGDDRPDNRPDVRRSERRDEAHDAPPPRPAAKPRRAGKDADERAPRATASERRRMGEDAYFMVSALAAWDVKLTRSGLEYTRKLCFTAGQTREVEGRTKICPDVRHRIHFKGLQVGDYKRKYYFVGQREIEVTGKIQRKMTYDFRRFPSRVRRQLIKEYKQIAKNDTTLIPIRNDVPIARVSQLLRDYARRAGGA